MISSSQRYLRGLSWYKLDIIIMQLSDRSQKVKNIHTKQSNKRNNQNSKDKTITGNKEIQMTGQHEPL